MLRCVCVILWEGCCQFYRKGKGCACATLCVFLYRKGCSGACATQKVPLWKRVLLIHSSGVRLSGAAYNVYNEYYKYLYVCMCCIHVYMVGHISRLGFTCCCGLFDLPLAVPGVSCLGFLFYKLILGW